MTVLVECPRCHRPVAELWLAGGRVSIVGETRAENDDPGGVLTVYGGKHRGWSARVYSSDPALAPGTASATGRRTLVCGGRRCRKPGGERFQWAITEDAMTVGYHRAEIAGHKRIPVTDLVR